MAADNGYVSHYRGQRRQDWTTPRRMFDALNAEYAFTLDGASDEENALLSNALTKDDVLVSWAGERVFCNPPWSRIREFVELAGFADLAVLLVPARVNTRWWCGSFSASPGSETRSPTPRSIAYYSYSERSVDCRED